MKTQYRFNPIQLALVTTLASSAFVASAAQAEGNIETIQVSGIRGSLNKSAAIKRDSVGVVDAISAEDIGKFPDTNLAESLQRITGVAIDRTNNEGNQVTVRGLGPNFNLVTLNDRQMPNSSALQSRGISRSFNFREIAAETVSEVQVMKSSQANLDSGGIGATINIRTARPFDRPGFRAHASAKAIVDTSVDKGDSVTPELSGMVSNTFMDDTVGVLLSVSHSARDSHVDRTGTSGDWARLTSDDADNIDTSNTNTSTNPTNEIWSVETIDYEKIDYERERQNAQLVVQWAPHDSVVATLDYTLSRLDEKGKQNRMSYWFDGFDDGATDENGTLVTASRDNDELNFWAWEYAFETENDSLGINVEWQATDQLKLFLDAHDSTSHANPGALPAERIANLKNPFSDAYPVTINADFTGDLPLASYNDFNLNGGAFDQDNIIADLYQERGYEVENNIKQLKLGGVLELYQGSFDQKLSFGVSSTEYKVDVLNIYNRNFALGNTMDISALNLSFESGGAGFESLPRYSAAQFIDLVSEQNLRNVEEVSENGIEEITDAVYIKYDLSGEIDGMSFNANAGLRYEQTDVKAYSVLQPVIGLHWITEIGIDQIKAETTASYEASDYDYLLPSLSFSLDLNDDMVVRAAYSKTIARSNISAMFPNTNLVTRVDTFTASIGNPGLSPYEADNYDLSYEWYYDDTSYLSVSYFLKNVDNYIATGTTDRTLSGPVSEFNNNGVYTDPSAANRADCTKGDVRNNACKSRPTDPEIIWRVTTSENINATTVDGIEFNVQHIFGDTGFGGIANYTYVSTSDEYDIYSLENKFAINGLSDTANLVAFYEDEVFEARIAYNWRDKFLLSSGVEPKFTEAYSQIDISGSYQINDMLSVFVEGINVTNEETRRHGRFANQLIDFEEYGARYNFGVRAKF
ncbi:TonB-dependent receptor [Gayadomonas joobiniege]|uniref:TonB-dependent receptor n=1 Tax=Gayadomonas joobiniege TaxID=1234606 RepID=UPI00035D254B|nr:TonB-dependent receptor [Gayadomonas joobiniege]